MENIQQPKHLAYLQSLTTRPRFNLSDSCGPVLTLSELYHLIGQKTDDLFNTSLAYNPINGTEALRSAVAALPLYKMRPDNVSVFSGAQEAIFCCLSAIIEHGDEVVVASSSYPSLQQTPKLLGAKVKTFNLDCGIDLGLLLKLINHKTKLVIINTPHNPTGHSFTSNQLQRILDEAEKVGCWLLFDDVSRELSTTSASFEPLQYSRAISIGVLSKAYGLSGIRVGWLVTRNQDLHQHVANVRSFTSICLSALDDKLATCALLNHQLLLTRTRNILKKNQQLFETVIQQFGFIQPPKYSGGLVNQVCFESISQERFQQWCLSAAKTEDILMLPLDLFGSTRVGFRLGLGNHKFEQAIECFEQACLRLHS